MELRTGEFMITELQWLKMHLRLAAREQSGPRLSYRFGFFLEPDIDVTCDIYYVDDDSNSMKQVSQDERMEIYEGRIALGTNIIRRALELAELPPSFVWTPMLKFILYENCGMGGAVVYETEKPFAWPGDS